MANLTDIKGVGDKILNKLNAIGITTVEELVDYLPTNYLDLGKCREIDEVTLGDYALLKVWIKDIKPYRRTKSGLGLTQATAYQEGVLISLSWFNMPYISTKLSQGEYYIYGKIGEYKGNYAITNPVVKEYDEQKDFLNIIPIYPLKESIPQATFRKIINNALDLAQYDTPFDTLRLKDSYCIAHTASEMKSIYKAHYNLAINEMAQGFLEYRKSRGETTTKIPKVVKNATVEQLFSYTLTPTQAKAIDDINVDLQSSNTMNRLILGDVGSGKTAVAFASLYYNYLSGYQGVMVAPTQTLANQHYDNAVATFLKHGIRVAMLSQAHKAAELREIKEQIKNNLVDIVIGTHSCMSQDVIYANLGLVIVDEAHKFGVKQRAQIVAKGCGVDCLVMSATPLPRSLAMVMYGDLNVSKLALRATQNKVKTYIMRDNKLEGLYKYIQSKVDDGEQAFLICPRVEDADGFEITSSKALYKSLAANQFKGYNVGLLHGKMTAQAKADTMSSFAEGRISILVATSLVEVGIDVSNATVIAIISADNFGLSSLHQLRGRVGRGEKSGECFLHIKSKEIPPRLIALRDNNDGIALAEIDAKIRGYGDIVGERQKGKRGYERYKIRITNGMVAQAKKLADTIPLADSEQNKQQPLTILLN